jgi:hypothetical protein
MKKIIIVFFIGFCLTTFSNAQDYNTGIGLRGGFSNGITLKHFIGTNTAIEGILSSRRGGFQLTGLYELHYSFFDTERLNWYFGGGAHIGFWDGNHAYYWDDPNRSYTVVGIDGILGLEYNFREVPINLSLDWKPAYNFFGYSGFWADGGAISVRYIF